MKKIYSLLCFITFSLMAVSQSPILTMISDGDCSGGNPKVVEIYAQGTVDFSLYSLEIQTNSNTTWSSTDNLGALGIITNDFVYIYGSSGASIFASEYPSAINTYATGGSVNFNGNDRIRIIEDASGSIIDQYGEDGIDGTDTFWEYKDGFGKRVNSTGPDGAFVQANWEYNNGVLNNQGSCQNGDTFESISTIGSFVAPGVGSDPTVSSSSAELSNFVQFVGSPSDEQTTEVTGANLTTDVSLSVSGDYEISLTTGSGFGTSLVISPNVGEIASTIIYVRLNGSATANTSNGEISYDFGGSMSPTTIVTLSGEILTPDPVLFSSEDTLIGFSHFVGAPSSEQTFVVSGNFLTEDITVDVSGDYEISSSSAGTFSNSLLLPNIGGQVQSAEVFVRLNGASQNYSQEGIVSISSQSQAVSHTVNSGNYYYQPQFLTINVGDTVYWINDGGYHNVNFITNTVTSENYNNPESFASAPTSDTEMYFHVFTLPGTYEYDCSVGSHAANGMVGTITVVAGSSPESKTIVLSGETLDYISADIASVTTNDSSLLVDSLGVYVSLEGVVHCIDFDGNEGLSFTMIDADNNGINVFNFANVSDYIVTEGDEIRVLGQIEQYNGLIEVVSDSIEVLSSGNSIQQATIVTDLNEASESQWVTLENVSFVDPIATFPSGNNNLDVTDGNNVYNLRIDGDTDIPEGVAPQGLFDVTGIGGQYDSSSPFDSGYQLFPCGLASFELASTSGIVETIPFNVGVFPNPFSNEVEVAFSFGNQSSLIVRDVQGRIILRKNIIHGDKLSTFDWQKGIYLFTFEDELGHEQTLRILK